MKKLFLIAAIITFSFSDVIDLGTDGQLYEITEENLYKTIEDSVKELQVNPEIIQNQIKEAVKKQSFGETDLPFGTETKIYEDINYQVLEQDIVNPLGRVFKKAGDKILMDTYPALDLCFVDGSDMTMLRNQIKYFDEIVKQKSGNDAECTYMVSNRLVLELNREYHPRLFYPSKKAYEDRFMVKSIPTYIHIIGKKKYFYSLPMDMFKHEVKFK